MAVFRKGLQRGWKARNSSAPKSTPNKLKSLKVAHIKDEMDVDEDEDGVWDVVWFGDIVWWCSVVMLCDDVVCDGVWDVVCDGVSCIEGSGKMKWMILSS